MQDAIRLAFLTEDDCAKIVDAALKVLQETGCEVHSERACDLFEKAGCSVDGTRVRIPADVMRAAIATVPKKIELYNRDGDVACVLDAKSDETYFAAGISSVNRLDIDTGVSRPTVQRDAVEAGYVQDHLDNLDIACSLTSITDCPSELVEVYETKLMIESTRKPFMMNTFRPENVATEVELLSTMRDSKADLAARPYVIGGQCALSPLGHDGKAMENLIALFENGIPSYYIGAPSMGGTGPITYAGSFVVSLADCFVGLLLSQIVRKGSPFISSCFVDAMNFQNASFTFSSPEFLRVSAGPAEIFRYLDLPYLVHLGATDSPVFDQEAAFDISAQVLTGVASKANVSFFLGFMEGAMSSSLESLVYGDEAISYAKVAMQPIEVTDETIAADLIAEVGPGGNFLAEEHTVEHLGELWKPRNIIRSTTYEDWAQAGKKDMGARINARVRELIAEGPINPLDDARKAQLEAILAAAEK